MEMSIKSIRVGKRFRKDLGNIDGLARNIKEGRLLNPIIVTPGNKLVCGQRRLEACRKIGKKSVPVLVLDVPKKDQLKAECDENSFRKDYLPSEAVAITRELEASLVTKRGRPGKCGKKGTPGRKRDALARSVGMSGRTLEKARAIVAAAERNPRKYARLVSEMDLLGKVDAAFRKLRNSKGRATKGRKPDAPAIRGNVLHIPFPKKPSPTDLANSILNPRTAKLILKLSGLRDGITIQADWN